MTEQPTTDVAASEQPTVTASTSDRSRRNVFSTGFQFHEFSVFLAALIPIAFVVLGLVEALGLLWRPIAGLLYLLLLVASMFILLGVSLGKELAKSGQEEAVVSLIAIFGLFVIVSFSQLGRYLYLWFGGFTASQSGYWHWIRFGIANTLESVLLDIPAIYNWNVTDVQATTFWSQTLVFLFRTSLELLVIAQLIDTVARLPTCSWSSPLGMQ